MCMRSCVPRLPRNPTRRQRPIRWRERVRNAETLLHGAHLLAARPGCASTEIPPQPAGLDRSRRPALIMLIMGISCYYHDSAAAIIDSDEIKFAIQEERL